MVNGYIINMEKELKTFEDFKKFTKNDLKLCGRVIDTKKELNRVMHLMCDTLRKMPKKSPNEKVKMRKLMDSCDFEWEVITPYTKK